MQLDQVAVGDGDFADGRFVVDADFVLLLEDVVQVEVHKLGFYLS